MGSFQHAAIRFGHRAVVVAAYCKWELASIAVRRMWSLVADGHYQCGPFGISRGSRIGVAHWDFVIPLGHEPLRDPNARPSRNLLARYVLFAGGTARILQNEIQVRPRANS